MTTDSIPSKRCTKCGEEFPRTREYFFGDRTHPDNLRSQCKKCEQRLKPPKVYDPPLPEGYQRCTKCNQDFPATPKFFRRDKRKTIGIGSFCIKCNRKQAHQFADENREYTRINAREWNKNNPDKVLERSRKKRAENPEYANEANRQYRKRHPEVGAAHRAQRRARLRKAGGSYTPDDVRLQIKAQTNRKGDLCCWWCGTIINGNDYHVDHRIPLAKGGSNNAGNICIACPSCNLSKSAKLPHEFNGRLL